MTRRLPGYYHIDPVRDIQVLAPMKKGEAGVFALNRMLQEQLNPPSRHKKERLSGETRFREGDKVMQVRNNYQAEWTRGDMEREEEGRRHLQRRHRRHREHRRRRRAGLL